MQKSQRILIVDDEKNTRLTLAQTLETVGYHVETAVNREDALKQLAVGVFDLILLDPRMPGMDGVDVLKQIVEQRPETPVVVVTAHSTVDTAVEAMKIGAVDFVQKPFAPQDMRSLVAQVLDPSQHGPNYDVYLDFARRNIGQRHYAAAKEQVRKAIAQDSARPEAFNLLGAIHDIEGDHHTAMANYRIALDLSPTYSPARANMTLSGAGPRSTSKLDLGAPG